MELIDEVLDAPQRIRVVLCGNSTPKEELCVAAALRATDNGQTVLFFTPTPLGQAAILDRFPDQLPPELTFMTLERLARMPFVDTAVQYLLEFRPALIILQNAFLPSRWRETQVVSILRGLLRHSSARLLIVSLPHRQMDRPLAASRLYRLSRQAEVMPEFIGCWRWPTPMELVQQFSYYYTPEMLARELRAEWTP